LSELWEIIGLSSLIASIVTIIGNALLTIFVEKKRFQREREAGYIQEQIKSYNKIYFLIQRIRVGAIGDLLFPDFINEIKTLNNNVKDSSFLLETNILMKWFEINNLFIKIGNLEEIGQDQLFDKLCLEMDNLISLIEKKVNDDLNLRYKEIVGKTVPELKKIKVVRK